MSIFIECELFLIVAEDSKKSFVAVYVMTSILSLGM